MARESLATRLYRGQVSYDFIGRRRRWYAASGVVILVSLLSLLFRGLHPSIDFKGGAVFQFPKNGHSITDVRNAVGAAGVTPEVVTVTGAAGESRFRVETKALSQTRENDKVSAVVASIKSRIGVTENSINVSTVGSTWGSQITKKAVYGLVIFLIAVIIYLSFRFEWKMALSAIIALIHDLIITAGIYSLVGFEVSPSTVIALLTILGYSLYDTVVVFDKVRENTAGLAGGSRMTFSQAANLAVNQTLVRSINTSIIALLPVAGLLIIGAGLLGAGSLKDLALALLIGLASGAYSSIFIATPLVADMKEREPQYQQLARRVAARQTKEGGAPPASAATAAVGRDDRPAAAPTATAVLDDGDEAAAAGQPPERPAAPRWSRRTTRWSRRTTGAQAPVSPVDLPALLRQRVRDVPDYPRPGVVFKDISPLLADHVAFAGAVDAIVAHHGRGTIDKVVGIEARGFIVAAPVAYHFGAGFVPVRKKGKLPSATYEVDYELEYAEAVLEVHQDAFERGDRVLIVDDVLATGGTVAATAELIARAGGLLLGCSVLLELTFLGGRDRLTGLDVHSLLTY